MSWQLEEEDKELHYLEYDTELDQAWTTVKVTDEEIEAFREDRLFFGDVFNDGRKVY